MEGYVSPTGRAAFFKLVSADRVLFATLEDQIPFFIVVALTRALRRRETAAIFMGPGRCFERGALKYTIKRAVFRQLNKVRMIKLLSILPFYLDKRFAEVAGDWIYDPEFWDLSAMSNSAACNSNALADEVKAAAAGRPVVLYLGGISDIKGFPFLVKIMLQNPALTKTSLFVAAGRVPASHFGAADDFSAAGGWLVNRFLSDDEVVALKIHAHSLWACYHPSYNSSSGIFGRAMQLGKRAIVRRGSYLDLIAENFNFPAIRCTFGDVADGSRAIHKAIDDSQLVELEGVGKLCKELSLERLRKALSLPSDTGKFMNSK
jgi:hypothetical protein